MTRRIAVKRLSAVEVDPDTSHQHEFHAVPSGGSLGFQLADRAASSGWPYTSLTTPPMSW